MPDKQQSKRRRRRTTEKSLGQESEVDNMESTQVSMSAISAQLREFAAKTSASFEKLNVAICTLSDDMKSLREEVVSVKQSVSFAHEEIGELKKETTSSIAKLEKRVNELEGKLLLSELYSKKQNLLFWGITVEKEENVIEKVYKFMEEKLGMQNVRGIHLVNVHRLPKMRGNPIICKFVSMLDRDKVLKHAYGLPPKSGVGVSVHLPVPIQKAKEQFRDAFRDAKTKDLKPKFKIDGVTVYLCIAGGAMFKTPEEYFNLPS
ncbi:PREDICTED: uncharacterized protein LOC109467714 [Branchiostoma belcheri]|uniref:Uncharacterized protein LOC109467714 n=1 Tax=Branchiostoma belcheri TaxID=7741 RepID=A0A6P4XXF9_BRABE|nr:PREDICTED: uncharacterized protein LOC109467714 [Branchiostoma belcheri]